VAVLLIQGKNLIVGSYRFGTNLVAAQRNYLGGGIEFIAPIRESYVIDNVGTATNPMSKYRIKIMEAFQNHFSEYDYGKLMYDDIVFMQKIFCKECISELFRVNHIILCLRPNVQRAAVSLGFARSTSDWTSDANFTEASTVSISLSDVISSLQISYRALRGLIKFYSRGLPSCEVILYPEFNIKGLSISRTYVADKERVFLALFNWRMGRCQSYIDQLGPSIVLKECSMCRLITLRLNSYFMNWKIAYLMRSLELE
jgi:hypothetical protein